MLAKDAADAGAQRLWKEAELNAVSAGLQVKGEGPKRLIADMITIYLAEIKISRTPATHAAYSLALRNFTDSCSKLAALYPEGTNLPRDPPARLAGPSPREQAI